jgi:hypothetical protein
MTTSTTANEGLGQAVGRLQEKQKGILQAKAVRKELQNAAASADGQLRALEELKAEFGNHFEQVAALDTEALHEDGTDIRTHVEAAKTWLADRQQWCAHFAEFSGWAAKPNPNATLEQVIAKIDAGKTAASTMRARAMKLQDELLKIV